MGRVIVISLGGSLIVPREADIRLLKEFKTALEKNYHKYKFVVVCGGGSIARKYISALKKQGKSNKELSLAGIRATRMNAMFVMQIFGKEANDALPKDMKNIKNFLRKNNVVICGALRYAPNETSDGTAAKLAHYFKSDFINMTNVSGLYTSDPKKNPKARLIGYESWDNFEKRAQSIGFKPGQHFILDQHAAKKIKKHKITTYLIGKSMRNLNSLINGKKFTGTTIGP